MAGLVGGGSNRASAAFNSDTRLRLDVIDQRGVKISDPVQTFNAQAVTPATGGQVTFQAFQTQGIDRIEVLRNISRDIGSATLLQTYPTNQLQLNRPIQTNDPAPFPTGTVLYYWLRAVPVHTKFQPIVHGPFQVTVP
jgi:hypothetical protein